MLKNHKKINKKLYKKKHKKICCQMKKGKQTQIMICKKTICKYSPKECHEDLKQTVKILLRRIKWGFYQLCHSPYSLE